MTTRLTYIWDDDLDEHQLRQLLDGTLILGRCWAAVRLNEYVPHRRSNEGKHE